MSPICRLHFFAKSSADTPSHEQRRNMAWALAIYLIDT